MRGVNKKYRLFNLTFESEIKFNEFPCVDDVQVDFSVIYASLPDKLESPAYNTSLLQIAKQEVLFISPHFGKILIKDGVEIIVDPNKSISATRLQDFVLSVALPVLLNMRNYFTLNASAVKFNGKTIAFIGYSGVGKSAIATAFVKNGAGLITDKVLAFKQTNSFVEILGSGLPYIQIWQDVIDDLNLNENKLKPVLSETEKFNWNVGNDSVTGIQSLDYIVQVNVTNKESNSFFELKSGEKMKNLLENTLVENMSYELGIGKFQFKSCIAIASNYPMYQLNRFQKSNVNTTMDYIIQNLNL